MGNTTSKKILVKASAAKPLTGVKTLGIGPDILFYAIKDIDETE